MVVNSILVRATDLVRCVECPLRGYIAYNESPQYDLYQKGTIWGSLEHNARALLGLALRNHLKDNQIIIKFNPQTIIDKIIYEVYTENPELEPYPPELVNNTISDLKNRLLIEETARLAKLKYLITSLPIEEALDAVGLTQYIEMMLHSCEHGLSGKVDAILKIKDELIPLDYKCADKFMAHKRYDIQIGIYALLIESHFGIPVKYGIIYDAKRFQTITIPITNDMRKEIAEARQTMFSIMQGNRPKGNPCKELCSECPYRRTCPEKWQGPSSTVPEDNPAISAFDKLMSSNGPIRYYDDEEVA